MRTASIAELKAHASALLRKVKEGEEIIVTDRGRPIARLSPYLGDASPSRLNQLAADGVIALPRAPLPAGFLSRPLPVCKRSVVDALLEEREEGF